MLSYSIYVVCSMYVTFLLPLERAPKVLASSWVPKLRNYCHTGQIYSSFICFKMWDIRSFSRLQSLTLTFTRYYSRYRGTRLVSIWLDQGFNSYVMYCTVLYCTVLYRTVLYYTVLYCTVYRDSFWERLFWIHHSELFGIS